MMDRLEAFRPKLTIENAYGWVIARDRDAFLRDRFAGARDLYAICAVFCDMLDAHQPWTQKDAMICAIVRRTYQGDPEKRPTAADVANAMLAMYDVFDIASIDKGDSIFGPTTLEGVWACYASKYRRDLLREMR